MQIISPKNKLYFFTIDKENALDVEFLKGYLLNDNLKLLNDLEFIRQILDLYNLLNMEKIAEFYQIEIIDNNVVLSIKRKIEWDHFEMKALSVNYTQTELNAFLKTLK
jgi:hypothetical protein